MKIKQHSGTRQREKDARNKETEDAPKREKLWRLRPASAGRVGLRPPDDANHNSHFGLVKDWPQNGGRKTPFRLDRVREYILQLAKDRVPTIIQWVCMNSGIMARNDLASRAIASMDRAIKRASERTIDKKAGPAAATARAIRGPTQQEQAVTILLPRMGWRVASAEGLRGGA